MNSIYRGKLKLLHDLQTCYCKLLPHFSNITLLKKLPLQIIIRFEKGTLLLFSGGQFRFMGKISHNFTIDIIKHINYIYSDVIMPPYLVSQTVVFKVLDECCPLNLHHIASIFKDDKYVRFENELFPALSLYYWKPVHVNVFSTGKVVVLGKDAVKLLSYIDTWLFINICLL